jgi:hypothetical protein
MEKKTTKKVLTTKTIRKKLADSIVQSAIKTHAQAKAKKEKKIRVPYTKDTYITEAEAVEKGMIPEPKKTDTWVAAVPKNIDVPYLGRASSPEYVTREAFDAQVLYMSNAMDNRFMAINSKFEERTTYQGWLVSPVLWKRSLAAYGHALFAHMVFAGIVVLIVMLLGL